MDAANVLTLFQINKRNFFENQPIKHFILVFFPAVHHYFLTYLIVSASSPVLLTMISLSTPSESCLLTISILSSAVHSVFPSAITLSRSLCIPRGKSFSPLTAANIAIEVGHVTFVHHGCRASSTVPRLLQHVVRQVSAPPLA